MPYAIYPPIGFARLGNSDEFYIGPEAAGSYGTELGAGGEQPVTSFKDSQYRMKRQGARFRIFEIGADGLPVPAVLPIGATVRWTVSLANRKDAIFRPPGPPSQPQAVRDDRSRADRVIAAEGVVAGSNQAAVVLTGTYRGAPVMLGDIRTDADQNMIVLAGRGRSASFDVPPAPMGESFYTNPGWFDDVADGLVEAVIEVPDAGPVDALAAWIVTTPPDFSPPSLGVVTLYDVIKQVAVGAGWLAEAPRPSFETDIWPIMQRAAGLRWVDGSEAWRLISRDRAALSNPSAAGAALRNQTVALVREVENALHDFALQDWQNSALDAWAAGDFDAAPRGDRGLCDILTRSALDGTVGQGFYPGIEAGINITDPALYLHTPFEFRFAPGAMRPGDGTAHMAQPWQADFLKCANGWWPSQRPDILDLPGGGQAQWLRPSMTHVQLVENVMKLGVATSDAAGSVVERGRDPAL